MYNFSLRLNNVKTEIKQSMGVEMGWWGRGMEHYGFMTAPFHACKSNMQLPRMQAFVLMNNQFCIELSVIDFLSCQPPG